MTKLSRAITAIGSARLPWHPGPEARRFLEGFATPGGAFAQRAVSLLTHPVIGPRFLPVAIRDTSRRGPVEAILRNTATPTRLRSGSAVNVIPSSVSVDIDGRLAPGQTAADLVRELEAIVAPILGDSGDFEILHHSEPVSFPADTPLYREIERTLASSDPGCHVVPSIIPGFTDSRNYAKLGATCYGFYPLQLPPDLDFAALFHGIDERIPVKGFHWGIETLSDMLRRFLTEPS